MTFILGINLSDRIYLAADTLVTAKNGRAYNPVGYCSKLISMAGKDHMPYSSFSCMFAGKKSFVDYIFQRLDRALDSNELDTDINNLLSSIDSFMHKIVPEYTGSPANRVAKIIFAGCSNIQNSVKPFNLDNLNNAMGPGAGHLDDINAVRGIQLGYVPGVPDQKMFSYIVDDRTKKFGIEEVGEMYSVISGGSKKLTEDEKHQLLRYFLSKRDETSEGKDIVNFLRDQFSETIGGAVTLGVIGKNKRLAYYEYDVKRVEKEHPKNWSMKIKGSNGVLTAIDPKGKEHNLIEGFYNISKGSNDESLELAST